MPWTCVTNNDSSRSSGYANFHRICFHVVRTAACSVRSHCCLMVGREEQAKNFIIIFSVGSFLLAAGIVFAMALIAIAV